MEHEYQRAVTRVQTALLFVTTWGRKYRGGANG